MATVTSTTPGPAKVYVNTAIPEPDKRTLASVTPNSSSRSQRRVIFNSSSWQSDKDASGFEVPVYFSGSIPWYPIAQGYLPAHALDSGFVDISFCGQYTANSSNPILLWRPYFADVEKERDASRTSEYPHDTVSADGFGWINSHNTLDTITAGQTYRLRGDIRLQGLGKNKTDPVIEVRGFIEMLQLSGGNGIGKTGDGSGILRYDIWHLIDGIDLWQAQILGCEFASTLDDAASTADFDILHIDDITGVLDCITLGKDH